MDYVFVSRGKSGDGFSNEPAASHFLEVPSSANDMKYLHRIRMPSFQHFALCGMALKHFLLCSNLIVVSIFMCWPILWGATLCAKRLTTRMILLG